jgi:hypothetical protein
MVVRSEVTALGEEVNEAARIEACASGGRALASKALIERLSRAHANALDLERVIYNHSTNWPLPPITRGVMRRPSVCGV